MDSRLEKLKQALASAVEGMSSEQLRWPRALMIAFKKEVLATTLLSPFFGAAIYSPRKRFQYSGAPSALPYVGWKRWHSIFGLIFGVLACTWTFSGMLSMDPFPGWQGERRSEVSVEGLEFEQDSERVIEALADRFKPASDVPRRGSRVGQR